MDNPFQNIPTIGAAPLDDVARMLREIGDDDSAAAVEEARQQQSRTRQLTGGARGISLGTILGRKAKWSHTAHTVGFIPAARDVAGTADIVAAGSIEADLALRGKPLRISLNTLCVASYPGFGIHHVLLDFYAQAQNVKDVDHLHFNATYRAQDGQHSGVIGQPIFVGIVPGPAGLALRCFTVNVKNDDDEKLISFLSRDVFKAGLKLLKTAQPAVAPLSEMALGLVTGIAQRARNVPVQDIHIGLDFGSTAGGARLAQGTYVAVQIPETGTLAWNWDQWLFDPGAGRIVLKADRSTLVPYNYLAFGVEAMPVDDEDAPSA